MRTNLPVTHREHPIEESATLLSTTDRHSHICYANAAFVEASGFDRDDLVGEAHNMVRHPDMPPQAFADMWATLRAGYSWSALVKNRRRDGDHYWVRANVTPVVRDAQVMGYMSVRTKPSRDEVAAAEQLYGRFRAGSAGRLAFRHGLVVHTGWTAVRSALQTLPLRWRLRLGLVALWPTTLLAAHGAGLPLASLAPLAGGLAIALWACDEWFKRQVVHPLRLVLRQASQVAAGQATENLALNRIDEVGAIWRAVQQSGLNMRSLIDDVSLQVDGLRTASGAIARGNETLSGQTEQAAANLQQTAAAIADITVAVRDNADTGRQAAVLAIHAAQAAQAGGALVGGVVDTMERIARSSDRIGDITGTIDGIAFQTNILALNAAVEAARAGDQGRGFAVVAGEVRALAQRSANAAKEIKHLIEGSAETIRDGHRQAAAARQSMAAIVSQVQQVAALIERISQATAAQTGGLSEVNTAVAELDRMTQQNAALVEEAAASSARMEQQTLRLAEAVQVFQGGGLVGPETGSRAAATARTMARNPVVALGV